MLPMKKRGQQFFRSLIFFVILLTGETGCSKSGATVAGPIDTYVSVMNLAPYGPTMDIYLNDTLVSPPGGIQPGNYSKQYGGIRPGNYEVKFKKTGSDSLLAEVPAAPFHSINFYTLIFYNSH